MTGSAPARHPSDSSEQRAAEALILEALSRQLGQPLDHKLTVEAGVKLDGFCDGTTPICVEVWAHQGSAKGGQPAKVMKDMCKLLLAERLLERPCRKVIAVCDPQALAFMQSSWTGMFAREFGIETICVAIDPTICNAVAQAQKRQWR